MKALILTADAFEEAELLVPYYRLREEGIPVDVAAPRSGRLRGEHGYPFQADKAFAEIGSLGHDLLIVPGGRAAEALAEDRAAVKIATWFVEEKHTAAAICHGPLVFVATGLMEEREMTGHPSCAPRACATSTRRLRPTAMSSPRAGPRTCRPSCAS